MAVLLHKKISYILIREPEIDLSFQRIALQSFLLKGFFVKRLFSIMGKQRGISYKLCGISYKISEKEIE